MNAAAILQLILAYGPDAVTLVQGLVTKLESGATLTLADVEAEFALLKPYAAYGIKQAGGPGTTA
jgi:hypothetical protein